MVKIDIEPIHDDTRSCIEDLVATFAIWKKYDYEMMFNHSWNFRMKKKEKDEELIGNLIKLSEYVDIDSIEKNLNFTLRYAETTCFDEFIDLIEENIKNSLPVIIYIDAYWCKWLELSYKKYHAPHFCMVVGLDRENEILHCIDANPINYGDTITFEECKEFYKCYLTFDESKDKPINMSLIEAVTSLLPKEDSDGRDNFDYIRYFGDVIKTIDVEDEFRGYMNYLHEAPLYKAVNDTIRLRKQTSMLLKYLGKKYSHARLNNFSEAFTKIEAKWTNVKGMIMKMLYVANKEILVNKISTKLYEIANEEELFCNNLNQYISNEGVQVTQPIFNEELGRDNHHENHIFQSYSFVELKDYYNNQGIESINGNMFSAGGGYFINKNFPNESIEWKIDDMKFKFPLIDKTENDNVSCEKQQISINSYECLSIMVLGCCEWGSYSEELIVNFVDDTSEILIIKLSDWGIKEPILGDKIAWRGHASKIDSKEEIFPVNIYAQKLYLNHKKAIKSIELPDCPNMHIFSLTLAK